VLTHSFAKDANEWGTPQSNSPLNPTAELELPLEATMEDRKPC